MRGCSCSSPRAGTHVPPISLTLTPLHPHDHPHYTPSTCSTGLQHWTPLVLALHPPLSVPARAAVCSIGGMHYASAAAATGTHVSLLAAWGPYPSLSPCTLEEWWGTDPCGPKYSAVQSQMSKACLPQAPACLENGGHQTMWAQVCCKYSRSCPRRAASRPCQAVLRNPKAPGQTPRTSHRHACRHVSNGR